MTSIKEITKVITPIADELNLKRVILFGSYARGDQTAKSDIDLIIDGGGTLDAYDVFYTIGRMLEVLPVKADIFEISEVKNPSRIMDAISREGVLLYGK